MYRTRTLEAYLKKASRQFPVLVVTGPRQVGKSTLLKHLAGHRRTVVTLDDPLACDLARVDPALFLQRFPPPVLIDEIQYAPQLLPHVKMLVDSMPAPGMFWLTGSQHFHLMKGISESLAGRVGVVQLAGLSAKEADGSGPRARPFLPGNAGLRPARSVSPVTLGPLYRRIWRGGYPAIALHPRMDWSLFHGSYVQTYVQRDVRDLARVGDEAAFLRFLRGAAARTGQMLNLTDLAGAAGVAVNTARSWLSILQTSGLVYLLEPYHSNLTSRLVKTPKLYFLDTGLCAYLTEWSSPSTLEAGAMSGAIFETYVMAELLKGYWHNGQRAPFFFYRDKDAREIDLLILRDGALHPVEIKKTASPGRFDVAHFATLKRLGVPVGAGGLVCLCAQAMPLTEFATAIPVGTI